jgi:hypothetical protein
MHTTKAKKTQYQQVVREFTTESKTHWDTPYKSFCLARVRAARQRRIPTSMFWWLFLISTPVPKTSSATSPGKWVSKRGLCSQPFRCPNNSSVCCGTLPGSSRCSARASRYE